MPLSEKAKAGLGIVGGVLLLGGVGTAFIFRDKLSAALGLKTIGGGNNGAGADNSIGSGSLGKDAGASSSPPAPDTSGDDPRCADVFKLSRAQMLSELGLDQKTPAGSGLFGNAPVNVGTPMMPKWVAPISDMTLRTRIMSRRGIAACGHSDSSNSFSGIDNRVNKSKAVLVSGRKINIA